MPPRGAAGGASSSKPRASPDIAAPVRLSVKCEDVKGGNDALEDELRGAGLDSVVDDIDAGSIKGYCHAKLRAVLSSRLMILLIILALHEVIAARHLWGFQHRATKLIMFTSSAVAAMEAATESRAYFTLLAIAKVITAGLGASLKSFTIRLGYTKPGEGGETTTSSRHKDGKNGIINFLRALMRIAFTRDGTPAGDAAVGSLLLQADKGWWEMVTGNGDIAVFGPCGTGGGYGAKTPHQGKANLTGNTFSGVAVVDGYAGAQPETAVSPEQMADQVQAILTQAEKNGVFATHPLSKVMPDLAALVPDFISVKHPQSDAGEVGGPAAAASKVEDLDKAYLLAAGVRKVIGPDPVTGVKTTLWFYDFEGEFIKPERVIELSLVQANANAAIGGHARAAPGGGITPEELALARAMAKEQLAAGDTRFARHSLSDVLGKQKSKNASNAMSNQRRRSRKKGSTAKEHQLRKGATHKFPSTLQAALEAEVDSRVSADGYSWHGRGAPKAVMAHMQSSSAVAAMPEEELPLLEVLRQASKPGISISTDKVWKALRYVIENRRYEVQERRGGPTRQQQKEEKEEEKKKKAAAGGGGGGGGGRGGGGRGGGRGGGAAAAAAAAAAAGGGAGGGGGGRGGKALGVAGGQVKKAK